MNTAECITTPALLADLELARQVQQSLLPGPNQSLHGWKIDYSFEPAGHVSGDYIDVISDKDCFYFLLGDVSGKGVAASMLMSHLHATVRALLSLDLSLEQIAAQASRTFCQSSLPAQFVTLVIGMAHAHGEIELLNAGHTPVTYSVSGKIKTLPASNIPLGLFCDSQFSAAQLTISLGDALLLHTDGVTEAYNEGGEEFGLKRLQDSFAEGLQHRAVPLIEHIRGDLADFIGKAVPPDDRTMLLLQRT